MYTSCRVPHESAVGRGVLPLLDRDTYCILHSLPIRIKVAEGSFIPLLTLTNVTVFVSEFPFNILGTSVSAPVLKLW